MYAAASAALRVGREPLARIRVADVLDPFGHVFGIIENPNFKLSL